MLIIERQAGELIQIGDEIQVCVLDTDGERVRIGVTTPRDVTVAAIDDAPDAPTLVEQNVPATAPGPARKDDAAGRS